MKKAYIFTLLLFLNISCASRTFYLNSDPSNAKVFYQSRNEKLHKGYTPLIFKDNPENISPATKIIFEKEGYKTKYVNVGGFEGDVSLHVELDKEIKEENKEIATTEKDAKPKLETKEETGVKQIDQIETAPIDTPVPATEKPEEKAFAALQEKLKNMEKTLSDLKGASESGKEDQTLVNQEGQIASSSPSAENKVNSALKNLFEAQKLVQANKLNDALVSTYKALALNDKFSYAYALQGSIFFLKKDYYQAVRAWEKASELDPTNQEVNNILNKVKVRLGEKF